MLKSTITDDRVITFGRTNLRQALLVGGADIRLTVDFSFRLKVKTQTSGDISFEVVIRGTCICRLS